MKRRLMSEGTTEISTIEHLILLDLLGAKRPLIRSYFLDTAWLFDAMLSVEQRLGDMGAFAYGSEQSMAPGKWTSFFMKRRQGGYNMGYIGDDHVPFLRRGVSILHIIAEPFPHVWHKITVSFCFFIEALSNIPSGRRNCTGHPNYEKVEFNT